MGIFKNFKKKRAIKRYMKRLPRLLAFEHGVSKSYKPVQVRKMIKKTKLSLEFKTYAMALLSSKYAFNRYYSKMKERHDYDALKEEAKGICSRVIPDSIPNAFLLNNASGGYSDSCGPSECGDGGGGDGGGGE